MNIVFFLLNLKTSGGGKVIVEIANGLSIKGHNVLLIAPRGSISNVYPIKVKTKEVGWRFKSNLATLLINLPLMIFSPVGMKPDVVISSFTIVSYFSYVFAKFRGAKPVLFAQHYEPLLFDSYHINNKFILFLYRWLSKKSYSLPGIEMISNSKWTHNKIVEATGVNFRCRIVPLSVNQNIYEAGKHFLKNSINTICCIYKPQKIKGWHTIKIAMNELHSRGIKFKLLIISPNTIIGDDFGLNCCYKVVHPPSDVEVAECYRASDLFISTSLYEGFGLPPLEAMACGVPVILTDSGGIREYAVNGKNCILIPPEDVDALINAVLMLMPNKKLKESLVIAGLDTATKRLYDDMISIFERFIMEIYEVNKLENTTNRSTFL